jgi:hypothetical protein
MMASPAQVGARRVVIALGGIAAILASSSGVIGAVSWAIATLGLVPVVVVGAFVAGAVLMHGVDYAVAARRRDAGRSP